MTEPKSTIEKIKELLNSLESEVEGTDEATFAHNFDALEVPSIVSSVVDYLQPQLFPYEAAIYWYLFRTSILSSGQQRG